MGMVPVLTSVQMSHAHMKSASTLPATMGSALTKTSQIKPTALTAITTVNATMEFALMCVPEKIAVGTGAQRVGTVGMVHVCTTPTSVMGNTALTTPMEFATHINVLTRVQTYNVLLTTVINLATVPTAPVFTVTTQGMVLIVRHTRMVFAKAANALILVMKTRVLIVRVKPPPVFMDNAPTPLYPMSCDARATVILAYATTESAKISALARSAPRLGAMKQANADTMGTVPTTHTNQMEPTARIISMVSAMTESARILVLEWLAMALNAKNLDIVCMANALLPPIRSMGRPVAITTMESHTRARVMDMDNALKSVLA